MGSTVMCQPVNGVPADQGGEEGIMLVDSDEDNNETSPVRRKRPRSSDYQEEVQVFR